VWQIVKNKNGTMRLEETPGGGLTVVVRLKAGIADAQGS
jgi:hypothetical protein